MKRVPRWWAIGLLLIGSLWGAVLFYYHTGASGVQIDGADAVDFHRGSAYSLFRISDEMALEVDASGSFEVVRYAPAFAPIALLCGSYMNDGTALAGARLTGDWLYGAPVKKWDETDPAKTSGVAAINLATGETISASYAKPADAAGDKRSIRPELTARGLTREGPALSLAATARLQPLSTCNEGCETFNYGFLFCATFWLLLLPVVLLWRRVKAAG